MAIGLAEAVKGGVESLSPVKTWGSVDAINGGVIRITGISRNARIGDRVMFQGSERTFGEIIAIAESEALAMPDSGIAGMSPGDRAYLCPPASVRPCSAWIGEVISSDGVFLNGAPTPKGERRMPLAPAGVPATKRRGLGERLNTGLAPFDTFLPICKGQRIGIFAGAGVGKSSLIATLANKMAADVVIIALIGERSREVRDFVLDSMGPEGRSRSIVFASTCDDPAPTKRRCALSAVAAAEYFRDQGLQVLLLFDSITRYADAHREIALTAGETPSLRAYPPSTFRELASLAERTGPGIDGAGDITALFTVLVAGSDMEEPIADMVRSILDGHFILEREIAERGRFPAVNIRRSVSRCLPHAATAEENKLLLKARNLIAAYDESSAMIQTGLYAAGSNPTVDRAIEIWPHLDGFISDEYESISASFERLDKILGDNNEAASM